MQRPKESKSSRKRGIFLGAAFFWFVWATFYIGGIALGPYNPILLTVFDRIFLTAFAITFAGLAAFAFRETLYYDRT